MRDRQRADDHAARRAADPGFLRLFHPRARDGAAAGRRSVRADRDLARLLVGREVPLHVLRPERHHGVPDQDRRSRGGRGRDAEERLWVSFVRVVDNILNSSFFDDFFRVWPQEARRHRVLRGQGQFAQASGQGAERSRHHVGPGRHRSLSTHTLKLIARAAAR